MIKKRFKNSTYLADPEELFATIIENKDIAPKIYNQMRKQLGFQGGAFVPGVGSGDKVPAMLEPGEFVFNRNAVAAAGAGNLESFNKKYSRFQKGGRVGMQEGGQASATVTMPDFTKLNENMQIFGNKLDILAESMNSISGMEIQLNATHKVEVVINGAQILQQLEPSIQNLIVSESNKAINAMLASKFPTISRTT